MTFADRLFERAADVDGVVFDFGGVISVSPVKDWPIYPYCAAKGVDRAAMDAGWKKYRYLWDGGFITFEELYGRIFADAGCPPPDATTLADLWELDSVGWIRVLRQDTLELIRRLKAAGKKIGILSNMPPDFYEQLYVPRAAEYRALADVEVISGLVKMYKPAKPIYDLMAQRIGLPPERLLFLDDVPSNVEAARSYGWQSEVYPMEINALGVSSAGRRKLPGFMKFSGRFSAKEAEAMRAFVNDADFSKVDEADSCK